MYVESRDELDSRIKELQEANKGLVSKAIDAIVGVLKTIYELGKLLLRVLLKAASAIGDIIAHPIRFLENLVGAVKGGLERFVSPDRRPPPEGAVDLLFGELGSAGITMPKELDFAGILDLVLQVLGLTYQSIRERVVRRFGEDVVAQMEAEGRRLQDARRARASPASGRGSARSSPTSRTSSSARSSRTSSSASSRPGSATSSRC